MEEQWNIFKNASKYLEWFAGWKFAASLGNNPDVEGFVTEINPETQLKAFSSVSVNVEHSFSQYKLFSTHHRPKLFVWKYWDAQYNCI